MATNGSSIPERIARWKVIHGGVRPLLPEMPFLTDLHTELGNVIVQSEELDARHEALKAETREVNRIREELATTGDDLRNRMGAALQTIHGFRSEKLIEFGLKPRRARGRDRRKRARRSGTAAPAQEQPAAGQPPQPAQTPA
jgi:DNA repair exonuclease SbcCD ATPase subunit